MVNIKVFCVYSTYTQNVIPKKRKLLEKFLFLFGSTKNRRAKTIFRAS